MKNAYNVLNFWNASGKKLVLGPWEDYVIASLGNNYSIDFLRKICGLEN